MLLIDLIHNVAILVTILVLYDLLGIGQATHSVAYRFLAGILFGAAAVLGMMSPLQFAPGVIYDGRSIVLAVAALLTGPIGGSVAGLLSAAYRYYLGGVGAAAGIAVIVTSVALGTAAYYLRRHNTWWNRTGALALVGLLVHVLMLLCQYLFLPESISWAVLTDIGYLVLIVFPAAFVLVTRLVLDREASRESEKERQASDELYRGLFENTHAAMVALRPGDGQVVDVNPAAVRFYGWSREEFRQKKMTEINLLTPEEAKTEMEKARRDEKQYFEFRHRRADGSVRDVAIQSGSATVRGEELLHSIVFDITPRKAAERERDLMLFGMDRAALGIMRIREADAVVESANQRACKLLGYSREEVEGMVVSDFDPSMTESRWAEHRQTVREKREYTIETEHRRKDGSSYPAEVTIAYVQYEGEDYSFSFFQDISERKEQEASLAASLKEKTSLLQEVHHRVKNNLAVIASLMSLQAAEAHTPEDAFSALEKTRDRINTMGEVHTSLYGSGELSQLEFCGFLRRRTQALAYNYRGTRSIELAVECRRIAIDVEVAVPLALIVNELVTNAYKHAFPTESEGAISVAVFLGDEKLTLLVKDNGTAGQWYDEHAGAGGLGIQLVKLLAEQIGGSLVVAENDGTEIAVSIPSSLAEPAD